MADNYTLQKSKKKSGWIYILLLFLSFVWLTFYPTTNSLIGTYMGNYGNLFSSANPNGDFIIISVLTDAFMYTILFEIAFYLYRIILSFKVYSFIVPNDVFKNECRTYFIYRNLFVGVFLNICFLFPYLYIYDDFIRILVSMPLLIVFSKHLTTTYGESIIGHFVFKNFCYPIFVYEAFVILLQIMGVL